MSKKIFLTNVCAPFSFVSPTVIMFPNYIAASTNTLSLGGVLFGHFILAPNGYIYAITYDGTQLVQIANETNLTNFHSSTTGDYSTSKNIFISYYSEGGYGTINVVIKDTNQLFIFGTTDSSNDSMLSILNTPTFNGTSPITGEIHYLNNAGIVKFLDFSNNASNTLVVNDPTLNAKKPSGLLFDSAGFIYVTTKNELLGYATFYNYGYFTVYNTSNELNGLSIDSGNYLYTIENSSGVSNIKKMDRSGIIQLTIPLNPNEPGKYIAVKPDASTIYFTTSSGRLNKVSAFYVKDVNGGQCDDLYLGITSTGTVYYHITASNNASGCSVNVYVYPWKSGVSTPNVDDFTLYILYDTTNGYYIASKSQMMSSTPVYTAINGISSSTSSGFVNQSKNMTYVLNPIILTTSQNFLSTLIGSSITSTRALPIKMFVATISSYVTNGATLPCKIYIMFYQTGKSVMYFYQKTSTSYTTWAVVSSDIMVPSSPDQTRFQYTYNNNRDTNNKFSNSNLVVPSFASQSPSPTVFNYTQATSALATPTIRMNLQYLPNNIVPTATYPLGTTTWSNLQLTSTTVAPTFITVTGNTFPNF